jgi:23S rRNA (uracil1939-C5)-methyltransferase
MVGEVQVQIESMAFKGYGVARIGGKVAFIPYSVTGDRALVEIAKEKKNYLTGRLAKLIEPSPWRVDPPCPYFGLCGGCQWQHIDYSIHGELKKQILTDVLARLGRLKEIPPVLVTSSPDPYGYRVRVQLKVKGTTIGYYQERSNQLVDIDHCPISHPLVNRIILLLRKEMPSFPPLKGIDINVSPEEGIGVLAIHPISFRQGFKDSLKVFLRNHPMIRGFSITRKGGSQFMGDPFLNISIPLNRPRWEKKIRFRASAASFFQVNLKQNQTLIETVLNFSDVKKNATVLDLYAGVGNLTLPLAVEAKEIFGIEENSMAVKDGRFNAEENEISNCDFIPGRVEDILKHWEKETPDLIVLDPPRTGCKAIADQICGLEPERIVYVSCEPTHLSRDLLLFSKNGYHLQKLGLIDMFPQTYHMEVVGLLTQS